MSIVVRLAEPAEYAAVGSLTAAAYEADGFAGGDYANVLRDAETRAGVADLLVATDQDGQLLGTVTLVPPDAPAAWRENYRDNTGTIRMLAVTKAARGRGVGAALTQECIDIARRRGWSQLTLVSQPDMATAHRIYQRAGFVRDPDLDFVVGNGLLLLGYSLAMQ